MGSCCVTRGARAPYKHRTSFIPMLDRWDSSQQFSHPLGECVYGARLLGSEPDLVLAGGGNASVKCAGIDPLGKPIDVLYVKGSGHDLRSITAQEFTPLDLNRVTQLARFEALTDAEMMNALRCFRLDASAPDPSVETILHAVIPRSAVQHAHADAILTITNSVHGSELTREVFGSGVIVVDYVMPGFVLAKRCAELMNGEIADDTRAIIVLRHGIFTFADDTKGAYRAMIDLVSAAEKYISSRQRQNVRGTLDSSPSHEELAELRAAISCAAGRPLVTRVCTTPTTQGFATHARLIDAAARGPATPDHMRYTRRIPLVGRNVTSYVREYTAMFERNASVVASAPAMHDPAPRIVIDPSIGLLAAGRTPAEATIALDIFLHTMNVISHAEELGGYRPAGEQELLRLRVLGPRTGHARQR